MICVKTKTNQHKSLIFSGSGISEHVDMYLDCLKFEEESKNLNENGKSIERPRLVHRLDKDTSGVLLLARSRQAAEKLQSIIKNHGTFRKMYLALVSGMPMPTEGRMKFAMEKALISGQEKMTVKDPKHLTKEQLKDMWLAVTEYRTLQGTTQASLVLLEPETGRTHQLRVGCAEALKTPILGDGKYGAEKSLLWKNFLGSKPKLHLHAWRILIRHPMTGKPIDISAKVPDFFTETLSLVGLKVPSLESVKPKNEKLVDKATMREEKEQNRNNKKFTSQSFSEKRKGGQFQKNSSSSSTRNFTQHNQKSIKRR